MEKETQTKAGLNIFKYMFISWGGTLKNYRVYDQNNLETIGLVNAQPSLNPLIQPYPVTLFPSPLPLPASFSLTSYFCFFLVYPLH